MLYQHVADTLPDSLSKRSVILRALAAVINPGHPTYDTIRAQLAGLQAVETLAGELVFHESRSEVRV